MAEHLHFSANLQLVTYMIIHDIYLICSLIIYNPVYFCYFIFFSPYFIKLISILSPPFIASVILSVLVTTAFYPTSPHFELKIVQIVLHELKSNLNYDTLNDYECNVEEFEIYKLVFERTLLITGCNEENMEEDVKEILECSIQLSQRDDVDVSNAHIDILGDEKILECYVDLEGRNDVMSSNSKDLEMLYEESDIFEDCIPEVRMESNEVVEELSKVGELIVVEKDGNGSKEEMGSVNKLSDYGKISEKSCSLGSPSSCNLSSHGSMKEEKEWERTLACKLYEERHNSQGGEEGMDSLWEDHAHDDFKTREGTMSKEYNSGISSFNDNEDDHDDENEEICNGHLCCLQALKLSSGKMNLGMRKPNLVNFLKALKGFGWWHHVKNNHCNKS